VSWRKTLSAEVRGSVGVGGPRAREEMRAGRTRALLLRHLHLAASDVVARHELGRMRTQVDLSGQVGHVVAPEVVREQRQRHDERHLAGPIRLDERQQLGAIALFERVLEVAQHVPEHVAVPAWRGDCPERLHELR
jgi:hypothetical protein